MRYSWYTFKREDRHDITFLSLKLRGDIGYSPAVPFARKEACDASLQRLPYLSGYIPWQKAGETIGYRVKLTDRTLRLLGYDERAVKNASAEAYPN